VERSPEVVGPRVDLGTELDQNFDEGRVAFASSEMERREAVGVGAVDDFEELVVLVELLFGVAEDLVNFIGVAAVYLSPVVHFDLLDVFLALPLLRRLLRNGRGVGVLRGLSGSLVRFLLVLVRVAAAVACKFVRFFVVVVVEVYYFVILVIAQWRLLEALHICVLLLQVRLNHRRLLSAQVLEPPATSELGHVLPRKSFLLQHSLIGAIGSHFLTQFV